MDNLGNKHKKRRESSEDKSSDILPNIVGISSVALIIICMLVLFYIVFLSRAAYQEEDSTSSNGVILNLDDNNLRITNEFSVPKKEDTWVSLDPSVISEDFSDPDPLSIDYDSQNYYYEGNILEEFIDYDPDPLSIDTSKKQLKKISEFDLDILCQFVLHEVGNNADFFVGDVDIDLMQQCIASCVTNRILSTDPALPETTVFDTLASPGFLGPDDMNALIDDDEDTHSSLEDYDPHDERTRQNVMKVLLGETIVPYDLIFEMGWKIYDENGNIVYDVDIIEARMEEDLGEIEIFYSAKSKEGYFCVFARKIW